MSQAGPEPSLTVGELLSRAEKFLAEKGSEFPRLDAQVLLAHSLNCTRIDLYGARYAEVASAAVRQQYRDLIRQRIEGCPVAYLVGKKEFFSLELEVSPAVLIPRPDTELVVTTCLDLARRGPQPKILDLGTGSGAIAIALARHLPAARVTATDISAEALEVARRNAVKHDVADRIHFVQGPMFEPVPANERFDFIVSNPPYIPSADIDSLPVGVRRYEPRLAVDGGPDGFAVFDALLAGAASHLVPGGCLIIEIGAPQEKPARERFAGYPCYQLAATVYDLSRHPRVLWARLVP